jgi:hypothetical protein
MERPDIPVIPEHDNLDLEIEGDLDRVDYSQSLPPMTGPILDSTSLPGFEDA